MLFSDFSDRSQARNTSLQTRNKTACFSQLRSRSNTYLKPALTHFLPLKQSTISFRCKLKISELNFLLTGETLLSSELWGTFPKVLMLLDGFQHLRCFICGGRLRGLEAAPSEQPNSTKHQSDKALACLISVSSVISPISARHAHALRQMPVSVLC